MTDKKTPEQLLEELNILILMNTRDKLRKVGLPYNEQQWWNRYLASERAVLAEQYKILTGNDLDPKPEEKKPEEEGGPDGREKARV
jgi:hypothetical protein